MVQFSYMPKLQRQKGMDEKYIKERRIKLTINLSVHTFFVLIFVFVFNEMILDFQACSFLGLFKYSNRWID